MKYLLEPNGTLHHYTEDQIIDYCNANYGETDDMDLALEEGLLCWDFFDDVADFLEGMGYLITNRNPHA